MEPRLARNCRSDHTPIAHHFVAARLFRAFEGNRIGLHARDRKKRIRFKFNSKPHSPLLFSLQHGQSPRLNFVSLDKLIYQRRLVAAVTRVTPQNERWRTVNTRDILDLVHELEEKGASLRVLDPTVDTGGPLGHMVLTVLGMVAELELGFIRDRQRAGVDAANARNLQGPPCHVRPRAYLVAAQGRNGRHGDRQGRRVQAGKRQQDS